MSLERLDAQLRKLYNGLAIGGLLLVYWFIATIASFKVALMLFTLVGVVLGIFVLMWYIIDGISVTTAYRRIFKQFEDARGLFAKETAKNHLDELRLLYLGRRWSRPLINWLDKTVGYEEATRGVE